MKSRLIINSQLKLGYKFDSLSNGNGTKIWTSFYLSIVREWLADIENIYTNPKVTDRKEVTNKLLRCECCFEKKKDNEILFVFVHCIVDDWVWWLWFDPPRLDSQISQVESNVLLLHGMAWHGPLTCPLLPAARIARAIHGPHTPRLN